MSKYYNICDVTDKVRAIIGEQIRSAQYVGYDDMAKEWRDDSLIVETSRGLILNPNFNGEVNILFDNGARIVVAGSDYVSVFIESDKNP